MPKKELKKGDAAPGFTLPSSEGGTILLDQFKGKKSVVLFFYPKDHTPGCTKEACDFRDGLSRFHKKNTMVFGISLDSIDSHQRFIDKYNLTFPLLSDEDISVSKAYSVYKQKSLYGRKFWGIERTTFIIGKDGKINEIFQKVKVDGHADEVLKALSNK